MTTRSPYESASSLASALSAGEITSVAATTAMLERIAEVDDAVNAVVTLAAERALIEAEQADEKLAQGDIIGPLHGLPITIKDSLDTEGIVSTGGTPGRAAFVPPKDATVVARLRAAGAIVVAKSNTPELTLSFETDNEVAGKTLNPYNTAHSPGGSSGGAGALLAAGATPLEVGSDCGGSIRVPSAFCGTAGIKPTMGRVPRTGHIYPFGGVTDSFQQIGPMARYVDDLILTLPILAGPDGIDPAIVPMPLGSPDDVDLSTLRVAFYRSADVSPATSAIQRSVCEAAAALESAGANVKEVEPVAFREAFEVGTGLFSFDGGAARRRLLAGYGSPLPDQTPALDATQLDALIARWFDVRSRIARGYADFDVVLSPVNGGTAPLSGSAGRGASITAFSYTILHNVTGWPSGAVRCGTDEAGLPVSVQMTAHPAREDIVLAVARLLEEALGGFVPPTAFA